MNERALHLAVPGDLSAATGGYHYDRRIIEGLRALGWHVTVHLLDESFPFPVREALDGARAVFEALPDGACVLIDGLALGAMPDVVAAHSRRITSVGLVHHPLALESGLTSEDAARLKVSEQRALRAVRHVIVTSAYTRETLVPYGVDPASVSIVAPGTDEAPLARGSRDGTLEMICVANVIPRKGHDLLFHALGDLRQHPWRLTCVGRTAHRATMDVLERQVRELGLLDRVRFLGELTAPQLDKCLDESDLFVLATRHEGFGMAVAEALARGLPVVSTRTGAITELVSPGAGILVPPGDAAALHQALARVLTEPDLLSSLASGARVARTRLRRWPQACAEMSRLLEGILRG